MSWWSRATRATSEQPVPTVRKEIADLRASLERLERQARMAQLVLKALKARLVRLEQQVPTEPTAKP